MTDVSQNKDQELVVLGLGREGLSSYHYLRQKYPAKYITLLDEKTLDHLSDEWKTIANEDHTIHFSTTVPEDLTKPLVFCSPGIPPKNALLAALQERGATITSNTDSLLSELSPLGSSVVTIGVTGTKGKSTTSALIYHLLKTAGKKVYYAGNVGVPPLDILSKIQTELTEKPDAVQYVVLELSSHQLLRVTHSPTIAVIQEIVPEHLDYYDTFEAYVAAKGTIALYQSPSDHVIYCTDFPTVSEIARKGPAQRHGYSLDLPQSNEVSTHIAEVLEKSETQLLGQHNRYNTAPSIIISTLFSIPENTLQKALKTFTPLPHRLERVQTDNDAILYINDSLATTPEATCAAIAAFPDNRIILIAGGYDRSLDFHVLAKKIATSNIKALILFPPTGEKIIEILHRIAPTSPLLETSYFKVETMSEAVQTAKKMANRGDVVLLSPAAASFGRFTDYADRGNQFKQLVQEN